MKANWALLIFFIISEIGATALGAGLPEFNRPIRPEPKASTCKPDPQIAGVMDCPYIPPQAPGSGNSCNKGYFYSPGQFNQYGKNECMADMQCHKISMGVACGNPSKVYPTEGWNCNAEGYCMPSKMPILEPETAQVPVTPESNVARAPATIQ